MLPPHVWDVAFVAVVSAVPFVLLAGLVRFRLLQVEVYVVRTLARGVVVLLVLAAYAVAEAALHGRDGALAAVLLTVLAALTGRPLVRRLQALADRWLTGGRVGSRAVLAELVGALAVHEPAGMAERICRSVAEGLDVAWVRLVVHGEPRATVGAAAGQAGSPSRCAPGARTSAGSSAGPGGAAGDGPSGRSSRRSPPRRRSHCGTRN